MREFGYTVPNTLQSLWWSTCQSSDHAWKVTVLKRHLLHRCTQHSLNNDKNRSLLLTNTIIRVVFHVKLKKQVIAAHKHKKHRCYHSWQWSFVMKSARFHEIPDIPGWPSHCTLWKTRRKWRICLESADFKLFRWILYEIYLISWNLQVKSTRFHEICSKFFQQNEL